MDEKKSKLVLSEDSTWTQRMLQSVGNGFSLCAPSAPPSIGVSDFVKRQRIESQFTHVESSWYNLILWTQEQICLDNWSEGYRDGVRIVHMGQSEVSLFFTYQDFKKFEGMRIDAAFERIAGREHEPPKLQIQIREPKNSCKFVDIIIYRKDVLLEGNDETTGADWDIVSMNGRLRKDAPPMTPLTIVRNWKQLPGGTEMKDAKAEDVLETLCQAVMFKNGIKG